MTSRDARRVWPHMLFGLIVALSLFAQRVAAQSPTNDVLTAIANGDFSRLSNVPAYRIRGYVTGFAGFIEGRCPALVRPKIVHDQRFDPIRFLSMGMELGKPAQNFGAGILLGAIVVSDKAFFEGTNNPQNGAAQWVKANGCSASRYATITRNIVKLFSSAQWAGAIQPMVKATCDAMTAGRSSCGCFATAADMQATPAERTSMFAPGDQAAALKKLIAKSGFGDVIGAKCRGLPDFSGSLEQTALRTFTTKGLGIVMRGWHNNGDTSYADTDRRARLQAALDYVMTLERAQRNGIPVLVCSYGPPTGIEATTGKDPAVRYLWYRTPGPSRSELGRNLDGYPFLEKLLAMGDSSVDSCPPSLTAARPAQSPPATADPVTISPPKPRMTSRNEQVEMAQQGRCARLLERLERSRLEAQTGRYPLSGLRRQEMLYATHCKSAD